MPITYTDKVLEEKNYHPLLTVKPDSDMVRYGKDGKSVFAWNRDEALAMYKWYCEDHEAARIEDEFGRILRFYEWQDIIKKSYYTGYVTEYVSQCTIEELWIENEARKLEIVNRDLVDILEKDDDDES